MSKDEIQESIIEDFSLYDDWLDKYEYIIGLSDSLEIIDASKKTPEYIIEGCQSRVWVDAETRNDKIYYRADSDAIIVKGLLALLQRAMNGRTAEEIVGLDLYFIDSIGLKENLSPTRGNGLYATIQQMKMYAVAFLAKKNEEK
ncbi:MAG: SufE family protein [Alistipes sp.]|nr:SufE family protein [Candidatus Alistipes equi]